MGCDIHAHYERKDKYGWWVDKGEAEEIGRDYELFSLLANVRNSYGIKPISWPKGIPKDASDEFQAYYREWDCDAHSPSFLSLKDLKGADLQQEFVLSDLKTWDSIIQTMESLKKEGQTDEDVRLVFFFDN